MIKVNKIVRVWLYIGVVMLFFQIIIGGITRLTGSGLSITKWEIVTGTLPPMTSASWNEAFDLYKETPQYEKINEGMSMSDFKFIYFWEYFHRLWARMMGFVFLFPFIFFLFKGWLPNHLIKRLMGVIALAVLAATFGWIMVASGLIERPWVNAYKLAFHLCIGISVYAYLFWTLLETYPNSYTAGWRSGLRSLGKVVTVMICIQIFLGGVMSGMKAGLFYPTWPDMNGEMFPQVLLNKGNWTVNNFNNYESTLLPSALIQLLHRTLAYIVFITGLVYIKKLYVCIKNTAFRNGIYLFSLLLVSQVILGILTLVNCIGIIPVGLGSLHQGFAILLLSAALYLNYLLLAPRGKKEIHLMDENF